MPYCTQCGHQNPEGSNFCAQCGAPLVKVEATDSEPAGDTTKAIPVILEESSGVTATELSAADAEALRQLPPGVAMLVVHRGPSAGAKFLLDSDVTTAGRHPGSEIFLDDITVSRHHVRFTKTPQGITVADVGSLNGTYVNRTLIEGDVLLKPGDEVQIGKFRMVFLASAPGSD